MKKLLSIVLALILVLSAIPMVMVSAEPIPEIYQNFEKDADGVSKTNVDGWRSQTYAYEGAYSYYVKLKTAVWNAHNTFVSSSNLKNYAKIAIPTSANITGNVGFYAYKTQYNGSKVDAWGVEFQDGTKYFTKYSQYAYNKNSWTNINFVGKTMYQYGATSNSKVISVEDFNNDTNKVVYIYAVLAGTTDKGYETYIDNVYYETNELKSSYFITIDGEQIAEVPFGETYTIPNPADHYCYTDGTNYYYGGEVITPDDDIELVSETEKTTVVYTMDEGSRMVAAATANIGYGKETAEYLDVDGDMKLALKVKSDQRGYFQLPENWSSKPYFKPIKMKIEYNKNVSTTVAFKNLAFSSELGRNNAASGNVYNIYTATTYFPTSPVITITEDMYDYKFVSGQFYAASSWSEAAPVYCYVDNVTITYEYDFDYVADTSAFVTTDTKASIRLNSKTGIRFYTKFDLELINAFNKDNEKVEFGTLIAPKDKIIDEITHEMGIEYKDFIDVKYTASTFHGENNDEFVGSITSIKEKNIPREFVARGYVKIGDVYYYSSTVCKRSLRDIAYYMIYIDDSGEYELLDSDAKSLVFDWAYSGNYVG